MKRLKMLKFMLSDFFKSKITRSICVVLLVMLFSSLVGPLGFYTFDNIYRKTPILSNVVSFLTVNEEVEMNVVMSEHAGDKETLSLKEDWYGNVFNSPFSFLGYSICGLFGVALLLLPVVVILTVILCLYIIYIVIDKLFQLISKIIIIPKKIKDYFKDLEKRVK